ncbi:hypothetical protein PCE1_001035 [Barthelona sp. PCE]
MGIHSFWKIIRPFGKKIPISELRGFKVAIDTAVWMARARYFVCDDEGNPVRSSAEVALINLISRLGVNGIQPVLIFEGRAPPLKYMTVQTRRMREKERMKRLEERKHSAMVKTLTEIAKANLPQLLDDTTSSTTVLSDITSSIVSQMGTTEKTLLDFDETIIPLDIGEIPSTVVEEPPSKAQCVDRALLKEVFRATVDSDSDSDSDSDFFSDSMLKDNDEEFTKGLVARIAKPTATEEVTVTAIINSVANVSQDVVDEKSNKSRVLATDEENIITEIQKVHEHPSSALVDEISSPNEVIAFEKGTKFTERETKRATETMVEHKSEEKFEEKHAAVSDDQLTTVSSPKFVETNEDESDVREDEDFNYVTGAEDENFAIERQNSEVRVDGAPELELLQNLPVSSLNCTSSILELCWLFNTPMIQSRGEAERLVCSLVSEHSAHFAYTTDSDAFCYMGRDCFLIRPTKQADMVELFSTNVLGAHGFTRCATIALSMLLGNDYCVGVFNLGLVTALCMLVCYYDYDMDSKDGVMTMLRRAQNLEDPVNVDDEHECMTFLKKVHHRLKFPNGFPHERIVSYLYDDVADRYDQFGNINHKMAPNFGDISKKIDSGTFDGFALRYLSRDYSRFKQLGPITDLYELSKENFDPQFEIEVAQQNLYGRSLSALRSIIEDRI